MAEVVAQFFQISGVNMVPPDNLAELIPYLLQVVVSVVLVVAVFKVISAIVQIFCNWRWFR